MMLFEVSLQEGFVGKRTVTGFNPSSGWRAFLTLKLVVDRKVVQSQTVVGWKSDFTVLAIFQTVTAKV